MKPQSFRRLVRQALDAQEMSVYRLAQESGVHQNTINNWLRGEVEIGADKLERVFAVLGLAVDADASTLAHMIIRTYNADGTQRVEDFLGNYILDSPKPIG